MRASARSTVAFTILCAAMLNTVASSPVRSQGRAAGGAVVIVHLQEAGGNPSAVSDCSDMEVFERPYHASGHLRAFPVRLQVPRIGRT
jgi:hypothetical protein